MPKLKDLTDSIDPINYITQTVLQSIGSTDLETKNNVRVFDGYSLDVVNPRKYNYRLSIRLDYMRTLCSIMYDRKGFVLKYSTAFMIVFQKGLFSTNLSDEQYDLDGLKSYISSVPELQNVDLNGLAETLIMCKRIYNEIISEQV